jgi:hypothetical protein
MGFNMATEQQLRDALIKADAAGDTVAANLFASKIKGLQDVDINIPADIPSDSQPISSPVGQGKETGFLQSVGEFFTGSDRETQATRDLPEIGQGGLLFGEDKVKAASITPALLTATNPEEMGKILTNNFTNIGVTSDKKGNLFARNNTTGASVVLNKPGVSQIDIMQGLGIAAAFTPAGRVAGALKVGAAAGATSAGIEALQALSGGEFDASQVAIDTVTAGLLDKAFQVAKATGRSIRDVLKKDANVDPDQILKSFEPQGFTSRKFSSKKTTGEKLTQATQKDLTPEAIQRIKQAESQGIQLTRAEALKDFGSAEAEQTLIKSISPEGEAARQFKDQQQVQLKQAADDFTQKFGGSSRLKEAQGDIADITARDKGAVIQEELKDIQELGRKEVSELYRQAGESTGEAVPLNNSSIVEIADEIIVNRPITPEVEKSINTALAKFGLIGDSVEKSSRNKFKVTDGGDVITITGDVTPLTLNNAEEFRKALNKAVGADQTGSAKLVVASLDDQVKIIIDAGSRSKIPVNIEQLRSGTVKISSENGKLLGTIDGDAFVVGGSTIKDITKRGKGEGKGLYNAAIDEAKDKGLKRFLSDESVTPDAARVWESLKKDGIPVVKNKDARFISDKHGGFWGVDGDLPVYSVDLSKVKQVDPTRTTAFKTARQAASDQIAKFKAKDVIQDLVGFKKGTKTPIVDAETVINKIVKGDKAVTNIRKIKQILLENPTKQSKKAWRSIQAEAIGDIFAQAINKDTLEISGARLNSAIKKYKPEALQELLGKKQFAELKRLQDTIGTATIPPPGTTNPSGTFTKLLNMTERLGNFAGLGQFNIGSLIVAGSKKGKELAQRKKVLSQITNSKLVELKASNPTMSRSALEKAARTLAFLEIRELDKENKNVQ